MKDNKDNQENYEVQELSSNISKAARSLHSAVKYICAVSINDFYNVSVKDLIKISLSDMGDPDILKNLGITLEPVKSDPALSAVFRSGEFAQLAELMYHAFAVRVPYLKRNELIQKRKIKDRFFYEVYASCIEKGASDPENIVRENFKSNLKDAKSKQPEPPFNGEWFRRWVYSHGGELAAINNRNIFLLGCVDALLPLYYAKLTDILTETMRPPPDVKLLN